MSAGPGGKHFIYPEVWGQLVADIVALLPSWCLLCKGGVLILKGMCVIEQSLGTVFLVWRAFVHWLCGQASERTLQYNCSIQLNALQCEQVCSELF